MARMTSSCSATNARSRAASGACATSSLIVHLCGSVDPPWWCQQRIGSSLPQISSDDDVVGITPDVLLPLATAGDEHQSGPAFAFEVSRQIDHGLGFAGG